MKPSRLVLALVFTWLGAMLALAASSDGGRVYELRTYTAAPGKRDALLKRFRDNTVRLFEQHGMVNVGYWVPVDDKDGGSDKLIYLLEHKNRNAATAAWKAFGADPKWKAVAKKSNETDGKIVAKVESVYLTPTDYSKAMQAGQRKGGSRVFELRTYTTPDGKLADLDARFRDHTVALFEKQGMTNLGYFHPLDADKGAGKTLIYFLAHQNRDAATASWQRFRDDPAWAKARTASEKNGKLTSKVESVFLTPVDFSALK